MKVLIQTFYALVYNILCYILKMSTRQTKPNTVLETLSQSIEPNMGESRFESYLAILTDLIGTDNIYETIVKTNNTIISVQKVSTKNSLPKIVDNLYQPIIYYYEPRSLDKSTHYRVYAHHETYGRNNKKTYRWTIIDPYDRYQKRNSHGFCQMFAFFITINDTDGFWNKAEPPYNSNEDMEPLHTHNTFVCLQKTIKLIEELPRSTKETIEREFEYIKNPNDDYHIPDYGIPHNMRFDDFISEMKMFKKHHVKEFIKSI